MPNPDLSTVTDEQLRRTAEMSADPLMWELAERFRRASAIASAAREAGMVDEVGRFRKILGTLPVTADGCVVGNHVVSVYYIDKRGKVRESLMLNRSFREPVYSTRSAAEAAKGGGDEPGTQ